MNIVKRLCLIIAVALTMDAFTMVPAFPQQGEVDTLNARVVALYRAGKFVEAVPLAQRALAILEKALPPNDPAIARSLNNLALLYKSQGRYADVEPLLKRSLAIKEKVVGPGHPSVALSLGNLAELYREEGRYPNQRKRNSLCLAVQPTTTGAHQAPDKRYYKRFQLSAVPMEDYEIRDMARRGARTVRDVFVGCRAVGTRLRPRQHHLKAHRDCVRGPQSISRAG
jgi:tetratricopeptide (TPR) repeat protein